jgi:hypothetical protein
MCLWKDFAGHSVVIEVRKNANVKGIPIQLEQQLGIFRIIVKYHSRRLFPNRYC